MLFVRSVRLGRLQLVNLLSAPKTIPFQTYMVHRELHKKSIYKTDEARKIRFYVIHKYIEYLKNYNKWLESQFPGALKAYRIFVDGTKEFLRDAKRYINIVRLLNMPSNSLQYQKLTRKEIELYHQMPKDMRKVAPILIISALPLVVYLLLPLAYWFPKFWLTSHYWTLQQRSEFSIQILRDRLVHNKPVFRHLQSQLDFLRTHALYDPWSKVLGMLGSGLKPTAEDILVCKDLFMAEPYHLLYLSHNHVKHLVRIHDVHAGWFRRTRLADRAKILIEMDKAILREGGVHNLPADALKQSCFIRGLNPINMKNEDMIKWLQDWIKISSNINKHNTSLLLHTPILLGYNEPSNWQIIYPPK